MKKFKTGTTLYWDDMYYVLLGHLEDIKNNQYYAFYATLEKPTLEDIIELLKGNLYPYYYSFERLENDIDSKYIGFIDGLDVMILKLQLSGVLKEPFMVIK